MSVQPGSQCPAGRTPVEQLYASAEEYLEFYLAHPEYFRMLAFQNRRLVGALRAGIAAGALRDVDPRAGGHDPVGVLERGHQPRLAGGLLAR